MDGLDHRLVFEGLEVTTCLAILLWLEISAPYIKRPAPSEPVPSQHLARRPLPQAAAPPFHYPLLLSTYTPQDGLAIRNPFERRRPRRIQCRREQRGGSWIQQRRRQSHGRLLRRETNRHRPDDEILRSRHLWPDCCLRRLPLGTLAVRQDRTVKDTCRSSGPSIRRDLKVRKDFGFSDRLEDHWLTIPDSSGTYWYGRLPASNPPGMSSRSQPMSPSTWPSSSPRTIPSLTLVTLLIEWAGMFLTFIAPSP